MDLIIVGISSAELYDPATETWTNTTSMNHPRWKHTASVLSNGKVLVIGGYDRNSINTAELYDPLTETWTDIANMNDPRGEHTVSILNNGRILVTGGSYVSTVLDSVEIY